MHISHHPTICSPPHLNRCMVGRYVESLQQNIFWKRKQVLCFAWEMFGTSMGDNNWIHNYETFLSKVVKDFECVSERLDTIGITKEELLFGTVHTDLTLTNGTVADLVMFQKREGLLWKSLFMWIFSFVLRQYLKKT
ncbi:hypothetical protein ILYODFUR_015639 [Ilyodon furcidens]|uniref:Uncharacterized protein n=1 Tax=Ilyodon furcidens TaxID=33524 RepID=A0ABV0UHS8_9TELE